MVHIVCYSEDIEEEIHIQSPNCTNMFNLVQFLVFTWT